MSIQLQKSTSEAGSVAGPLRRFESHSTSDYVSCTVHVPNGRTIVTATVVRPPQAVDDDHAMLEDTSLQIAAPGVLANDEDSRDAVLQALLDVPANYGTLDLDGSSSFRYQPLPDFGGPDSFTYHVEDAYGSTFGIASATIAVIRVNDALVFRIAANPRVIKVSAGAQTVPNFARDIGPGAGIDEQAQVLTFETSPGVAGGDSLAFSTSPSLAPDGTLTYTPMLGTYGKAIVTATLIDDGGTEDGGVDRTSHSFTVQVDPICLDFSAHRSADNDKALNVVPEPVKRGYTRGQIVRLAATPQPAERLVTRARCLPRREPRAGHLNAYHDRGPECVSDLRESPHADGDHYPRSSAPDP